MLELFSNVGFLLIVLSLTLIIYVSIMVLQMRRKSQIHYAFLVLIGTLFLWTLGALLLYLDYLSGAPINAHKVELAYAGLILSPIAILNLGVTFAKTKIQLSIKHTIFLVIPIVSMFLLVTNHHHQLFYRYLLYEDLTKVQALGSYFIIHTLYSYACITVGMWYLLFFSIKNAGFFSKQSILILTSIFISFGYNALLTLQIIDGYFHTNAIAFIVSCLLFYFAIMKLDFLNVMPIALQRVVDHISDGFMVLGKDGFIVDFNMTFYKTFEQILQIRRKHDLADLVGEIGNNPEAADLLMQFTVAVQNESSISYEKSLRIGDSMKHFSIEINPIYNNQGGYLSTIVLLKDITQVKEALNTIQRNNEILAEQERLASLGQLMGGIAHNLKTPIMSISGATEGLKDLIDEYKKSLSDPQVTIADHHEIAAEMKVWVNKIRPHCTYMSDIITTVKGQASQFSAETHMRFSLDELIKRVELLMNHELKRFHCELKINYEKDQIIEIKGEVNSLVQIFDNIITNSIHSYEGKRGVIELTIRLEENHVMFLLKDYGKGISLETQKKLFREMVTTKGKQGTGLGLYMSHATIKGKFKGNMWFESAPGKGTVFYISIPISNVTHVTNSESADIIRKPVDEDREFLTGAVE